MKTTGVNQENLVPASPFQNLAACEPAATTVSGFREHWVTTDEVIILLNISRRTLQRRRDEGLIAFSKIKGKIYYRISDIQRYLEEHYYPAFAVSNSNDFQTQPFARTTK